MRLYLESENLVFPQIILIILVFRGTYIFVELWKK